MLSAAGCTDAGRVRATNQDAFVVDQRLHLYLVADGMGGHNGGEVAAALAAETVRRFVADSRGDSAITWPSGFVPGASFEANQVRNALDIAHRRIAFEGQRAPELRDMGSTVVSLLANQGRVCCGHVGDSRAYLLRRGTLTQLTADHSWASDALRAGMSAADVKAAGRSHQLTAALGVRLPDEPALRELLLDDGDVLLLCSDGLHGIVDDGAIARVLSSGGPVADVARALVATANEAGAPDNVTAVVLRYAA